MSSIPPTDAEPAPAVAPSFRRLHSDVGIMVANKGAGLVFSIGSSAVLARELGPGGRGTVAVAFALTTILVQVATLGLASANPFFIAQRTASPRDVAVNSIWAGVLLGTVMLGCGVLLKHWFPGIVQGVSWEQLLLAMASIPAVLVSQFLQSALLGLGRSLAFNLTELVQTSGTFVALIVVLIVFHGGVTAAVATTAAGSVAGALAFAVQLRGHLSAVWRPQVSLMRRMIAYALRIYTATLLSFLVIRLDILLVNHYRGTRVAGIYSVTAALAQGMYLFPSAVGINLFPRIANGQATELTARVFRLSAVLYGCACLIAIPLIGPFIGALYGARYAQAATLFYWLVPGVFALGQLTVLANHFAGRGFPLSAMLVWFAGLAVNLAMNVALLPTHGAWVASLASSVAYTLLLVLHLRMFARENRGYRALIPRPSDFSLRAIRSLRATR